jgi:endonuclease G
LKLKPFKLLLLSCAVALSLSAASTSCSNIYYNNEAPDITNSKLTSKTKELCYKDFAVMHSGVSRTPLWSAEHLTKEMLAKKAERTDSFHAEERLSQDDRAELKDYARSGYDRGHMSPSADFSDTQSNEECFTLANMVPQNHDNNAGIWASIEGVARYLAKKDGEVYVITGPLFIGSDLKRIGGKVLVPTQIFKVIYVPSTGKGAAYITDNVPGKDYKVISIAEIEKMSGIDMFPKMSKSAKETPMDLPVPKPYNDKKFQGNNNRESDSGGGDSIIDNINKKVKNYYKGH